MTSPSLPPGPPEPQGPRNLRELAEASGIDPAEIDAAEADDALGLLLIDRLVAPSDERYTQAEVIERTGLGSEAVRFWRALGFPDPEPDDAVFGDDDVELLQIVDAALKLELLDKDTALQLARVIGSSIERIAQAEVDTIEARVESGDPAADGEIAVQRAQLLLPMMPRILDYVWRRHLQVAARRRMVGDAMASGGTRSTAVGFADLVGFTALAQQVDDHQLAEVVDRFEATAHEIVAKHGGRVVKMIGDEVMFEVTDAAAALEIGLDLADAHHADDTLSDIRVGVACGPVLAREGDLFGPTVNLASRLVSIAYPASVLASAEVREAVGDDDRFHFRSLRPRSLKHLGRVQIYAVRRPGDVTEGLAERARRRLGSARR